MLNSQFSGLEIAIIGMSGQFPGSDDCRQYWQNLKEGKESITTFSDEELRKMGVPEFELRNESYIKAVGVLKNKDSFDHRFFGYTPVEASLMDPQIRLFHEHCWKSLEDAGYTSLLERKRIGLFAGAAENTNWKLYVHGRSKDALVDPFYLGRISDPNYISTLISYKLNLTGTSLNIATACSTSLVAVDVACKNLLTRQCAMALAGGISIQTYKRKGYTYVENGVTSIDGHCRSFDAEASGTAMGEGVGVVVLKRLSEAIKDRDHIYAVIRSSASNNDGNHKVGYAAPSVKGQSDCIKSAHKMAGVEPSSISYIEAHGTGTKLGDPVEIKALNIAFNNEKDKYCAIGSAKTNIGHLDTAAGIAGLIKTVLSLKHKMIPASLNYERPNPEIDFDGGPFYVNTALKEWRRNGNVPLRAGVSSFGIGGTNAHVVLEEAPEEEEHEGGRTYKLLTISARTENSLKRYIDNLKDFLLEEPGISMPDFSYALQVGRKHFEIRKCIEYQDREELIRIMEAGGIASKTIKSVEKKTPIVFMFSGAGSQYVEMAKDLYEKEMMFKEEMDRAFGLLKELTGIDYKEIFYPMSDNDDRINSMKNAQPVIFIFGYSLARLIMSWGIKPDYMIGHSIGEYIPACISGVFDFENALRIVVKRGELMDSLADGAMLSAALRREEVGGFLNDEVSLAAINSPEQVVFSGDGLAIDLLAKDLEERGVSCARVHASRAGHSHMMNKILDEYREELDNVRMNMPKISFVSNLTGDYITAGEATSPEYWVRHMRETVQFSGGIRTLMGQDKEFVFIEVGGGSSLTGLLRQHYTDKCRPFGINLVRHPKEMDDDQKYLTGRIGQLWARGISIDWESYYKYEKRKRVPLPTYSFEPMKHPTEVDPFDNLQKSGIDWAASNENQDLKDWIYYPVWRNSVLVGDARDSSKNAYLFFSMDDKLSFEIKSELLKKGNKLVEVSKGKEFGKHSRIRYTIDPLRPNDFEKLFDELIKDRVEITDVIYCWSMDIDSSKIELEDGNSEIYLSYFSLVNIAKRFVCIGDLDDKKIVIITDSLYKVMGNEPIRYGQSLTLGVANVLPQEYSVSCLCIDLVLDEFGGADAGKLIEEIAYNDCKGERIVAFRFGRRWVQDFQRHSLPLINKKNVLKRGAVYLITGGLGNVGFILAEYLIKQYDAKVVITGRKKFDPQFIGNNNGKEEAVGRIKYLKSISDSVFYFSSDVSDMKGFGDVVLEIERAIGDIKGVVHTAGNIDMNNFELVEDISLKNSFSVFSPKIQGIRNIYELFKGKDLDFVWVASSLASLLGGLSFCSYSSASSYLDHFISAHSDELNNWKCIGLSEMLFNDEQAKRENSMKRTALKPSEIIDLFEWSLSVKGHHLILETVEDLYDRIRKVYIERRGIQSGVSVSEESVERLGRPDLSNEYVAPGTDTERKLIEIMSDLFGFENVGIEDNFFELGGDSLKAMVMIRRIEYYFKAKLKLKIFFEAKFIRDISDEIDEIVWLSLKSDKQFVSII